MLCGEKCKVWRASYLCLFGVFGKTNDKLFENVGE